LEVDRTSFFNALSLSSFLQCWDGTQKLQQARQLLYH
jgi:hypothetical protein